MEALAGNNSEINEIFSSIKYVLNGCKYKMLKCQQLKIYVYSRDDCIHSLKSAVFATAGLIFSAN